MGLHQIGVELCSSWGGDRDAAMAAWASSFDKERAEARTDADVSRVVTGLVNLHHDTPKERLWMEFFITCPIFVERQFDKYRMTVQYQDFQVEYLQAPFGRDGITQNELSGRYRTIPDRPYKTPDDVASIYSRADGQLSIQSCAENLTRLLENQHSAYSAQLFLLKQAEGQGRITNAEYKRAREVLRGVLGTAYLTDMRIVLNMNAFEHIINQRLAPASQTESRVVACLMIRRLLGMGRFPTMLEEMIKANGWQTWMDEVNALIANEPL